LYYHDVDVNGYRLNPDEEDELTEGDKSIFGTKALYPANLMRNMAISAARTTWVLTSEVDLALSPDSARRFSILINNVISENNQDDATGYVVTLLQDADGSCAGSESGSEKRAGVIKSASELPSDLRHMDEGGRRVGDQNGTRVRLKGCAYSSHTFMKYEAWMKATGMTDHANKKKYMDGLIFVDRLDSIDPRNSFAVFEPVRNSST